MAPEQLQGAEVKPSVDIYALGVLTFEMLSGRPPFEGEGTSLMYRIVHDPPPDIETLNADLPPIASEVLRRALAKSPQERWESASAFANALADAFTMTVSVVPIAPPAAPGPSAAAAVPAGSPAEVTDLTVTTPPVEAPRSGDETRSSEGMAGYVSDAVDVTSADTPGVAPPVAQSVPPSEALTRVTPALGLPAVDLSAAPPDEPVAPGPVAPEMDEAKEGAPAAAEAAPVPSPVAAPGRSPLRVLSRPVVWAPALVAALVLAAGLAYFLVIQPQAAARAEQETANAAALTFIDGVIAPACPSTNVPEDKLCVEPVSSADNAQRGIVVYAVVTESGQRVRAVLGRDSGRAWRFWYATASPSYQLNVLPGDLRVCADGQGVDIREEPSAQSRSIARANDQTVLRADGFVLTEASASLQRTGSGFYHVSGPQAGWVFSRQVSDSRFGNCDLRNRLERGR
jgi:hypothetical protein